MREAGSSTCSGRAVRIEHGDADDLGAAVAVAVIDIGDALDDLRRLHRAPPRLARRGGFVQVR